MFLIFMFIAAGAAYTSIGTSLAGFALANAAASVWSNLAVNSSPRNRPSAPDFTVMVSLVTTLLAVVFLAVTEVMGR